MHDRPSAAMILGAVAAALRADAALSSFDRRVAAAALDIARRELDQDPQIAQAAGARLARILGVTAGGDGVGDLMEQAADRIRAGEIGEQTPDLMDCLWTITLARVAVDQPTFALYGRLTGQEAPDEPEH